MSAGVGAGMQWQVGRERLEGGALWDPREMWAAGWEAVAGVLLHHERRDWGIQSWGTETGEGLQTDYLVLIIPLYVRNVEDFLLVLDSQPFGGVCFCFVGHLSL